MTGSPKKSGVVYEVNLAIDESIAEDFDAWLIEHIEEMLAVAGFVSASVYRGQPPPGAEAEAGYVYRSVQYNVTNRVALENYFRDEAASMRQQGIDRFGDKFTASRRILEDGHEITAEGQGEPDYCRNCGALLAGQYCAACGQRARTRLITLWELLKDVVGDLFELDSRLWRSLKPLLLRPGHLTRDYLAGRRVHYVPPFRMYLILSILFFVVVSFDEDGPAIFDEAEVSLGETLETEIESLRGETENPERALETHSDTNEAIKTCEKAEIDTGIAWLDSKENIEFLRRLCVQVVEKVTADEGAFARALYDNIPKMMFIFLPFLALVLKLLYIGTGRYYVEHLLFFVHYHAFFFLIVMLNVGFTNLGEFIHEPDWLIGLVTATVVLYIPVYLFIAMRKVYGQHFIVTFIKYGMLGITYFCALVVFVLITAAITALQ